MAQRLIVAAVGIPLILVVFLWLPPVWPVIMFAALGAIGAYELLWSTSFVRNVRITVLSCVLAVMIPFHYFSGGSEEVLLSGIFCYVVLIFCEALISHYQITFEKLGIAIFGAVIIPYFLSAFVRIRAAEGELGIYYILLPLVCSFASDAFALFAGLAWGKHKLAPDLSPKKTVEGAVGGLLGAVICCLIYGLIMQFGVKLRVNYFTLIVYGALGSLIAQIGDLSFSYIKRQTGLKDFGTIFPGHGGVLDRFDSVIFCAPLIEILIWLLPAFV